MDCTAGISLQRWGSGNFWLGGLKSTQRALWLLPKCAEVMKVLMQRWWQSCMPMAVSVQAGQRAASMPAAMQGQRLLISGPSAPTRTFPASQLPLNGLSGPYVQIRCTSLLCADGASREGANSVLAPACHQELANTSLRLDNTPGQSACYAHCRCLAQAQAQTWDGMVDPKHLHTVMRFRGRLVLTLQHWLWRAQAWQHAPSWEPQEGDVALTVRMTEALDILSEAVRLNDAELLRHCNLLQVVGFALL